MSGFCEVVVKGQLDSAWSGWFEGLTITHIDRDESLLSGRIRDQAALYGLLAKVRDMGLALISVHYTAGDSPKENGESDMDS